jgi:hypothetical protein
MITASGSIRLTDEAIPTPSIFTALSISLVARSSPWFNARSQTPLVSRSRPCSSMILKRSVLAPFFTSLRALISIASRPAYASIQPRRPQVQRAPPRFTTTWPISPAAPRPIQGFPSRISPPPTPVPHQTPRIVSNCLPAPSSNSPWTAT